MNLLKKLQARLLKRDIEKGKAPEYLAKKYPMSMLIQNDDFERINGTELYRPKAGTNDIYNIKGELLGFLRNINHVYEEDKKYIVVEKHDGKFENGTEDLSFAVYDKMGDCVVPHNCYSRCYFAEGYAILSTVMKPSQWMEREERIETAEDENKIMSSTGKSLKETLGGSTKNPKVLVVANDKIITTNYLSAQPLKPYDNLEVYAKNTIWISQTEKDEEITFKFNKNLKLLETYRLPLYSHNIEIFFIDSNTGAVYLLDTDNKRRINLRTGDYINLLNLKRAHLSKQERFADIEEEQQKIDDIVDGVIEEEPYEQPLEDIVEGLTEEEALTEDKIAEIKETEDRDCNPSLNGVGKDDRIIVLGDTVLSVGPEAEVVSNDDESIVSEND